jgi:uncharacterized delta-60 repeat protein
MKIASHLPRALLATAVSLGMPLASHAACTAGQLDTAFGAPATGGFVQYSPILLNGTGGSVEGMVVASDNGIVAMNGAGVDSGNTTVLGTTKFKRAGVLDTTFGGFGLASPGGFTPADNGFTSTLAQDPSGNLLVVRSDGAGLTVTRYTAAGDLDLTFGTSGSTSVNTFTNLYGGIVGAAAGPDGSVYVASAAQNPAAANSNQPLVMKLKPSGLPDPGFGTGGIAYLSFAALADPSTWGRATDVAVLAGGQLVVTGRMQVGPDHRVPFVAQVLANGTLDPGFGTAGVTSFEFAPVYPFAYGRKLAVQDDGKIVIAGTAFDPANTQSIALMRVLANGTPDAAFGIAGKATATTAFGIAGLHVTLQNNGKIVVGATITNDLAATSTTAAAARFTATGTLDTAFGAGGYATVTPAGYDQSNGSEALYVAGNKILLGIIAQRSTSSQNAQFMVRLDSGTGAGCH